MVWRRNYVAIDAVESLLQMAILLEVANTAVVRIVVGYLVVENFAMNEIYRADVANAGDCCCWCNG